jgi:2-polyprenyl-6-hydroxyphenyl methylase/3-demethylubiquinone-9 3-methyltransferase
MNETVNADPAELAKFSEQAHRWWDPDSEFGPLHAINPLRLQWIDGLAGLRGKRVVDVGCGGGILADSMARRGANVLGIDLATKALRRERPTSNTARAAPRRWPWSSRAASTW